MLVWSGQGMTQGSETARNRGVSAWLTKVQLRRSLDAFPVPPAAALKPTPFRCCRTRYSSGCKRLLPPPGPGEMIGPRLTDRKGQPARRPRQRGTRSQSAQVSRPSSGRPRPRLRQAQPSRQLPPRHRLLPRHRSPSHHRLPSRNQLPSKHRSPSRHLAPSGRPDHLPSRWRRHPGDRCARSAKAVGAGLESPGWPRWRSS